MQRFKQPNMDLHPDGEWIRYEDHCEAMKRIAGEAERCKCCGYLVTESEHRGCLRAAAPSASAQQAEPACDTDCVMAQECLYGCDPDDTDDVIRAMIDEWYFHADDHVKVKLEKFARAVFDRLSIAAPAPSASPAALTDEAFNAWSDEKCLSISQHKLYKRGYDFARALLAASPADHGEDARDAARWRECEDICHELSDERGDFVVVSLRKPAGQYRSTVEVFRAAIDAAMSASKEGA